MKLFRKIGLILLTGVLLFYIGYSLIKGTYSTEGEVPANSAFDDINFYKCVVDAYNNENNTSLSYTVNLSDEQLKTITELDCGHSNSSDEEKIVSSKGLEKLTLLKYLDLSYNKLTSLDVSNNSKLMFLDAAYNQLTSLDVSQNVALVYFDVGNNQLTSLNVSKNVALEELWACDNQLTSLDVSQNVALVGLVVWNNQLTSLDISQNSLLEGLNVSENRLTKLDVSNNPELTELYVSYNQLISLDVSQNQVLEYLLVHSNQLTSLDVSQNPKLIELGVSSNQLTSLDVSNNPELTELDVSDNQLISLDVSKNLALEELWAYENQLTSLDVSKNVELISLWVKTNRLTSLDVSGATSLEVLWVSGNQLTTLDVSQNPELRKLYAYNNQLTSLDVSQNPALEQLYVHNNQLTSLDVSQNSKLSSSDVNIYNNPYGEVLYVYKGNDIVVGSNVKIPGHLGWSNPSWSSTNSNVATVNSSGLVKTVGLGKAKINGVVSSQYETVSTLNVVEITSDIYEIDEDNNCIFLGSDVDIDKIKSNIKISDTDVNVDVDLDNYKLRVKYGNDVLKEFNLIVLYSLKYDLSKDYIYVVNDVFNLQDIKTGNLTKVVNNNNKLLIKYNNEVFREYELVSISSNVYDLSKDYIYIGTNDISNINVVNANLNVENDKLLIKYNEDVLDEYKLLSIKFNNYQVFGNSISNVNDDNYEDFISNIVCSDGITYKLYDGEDEVTSGIVSSGMKLDIYYNGNKIYEYIISDDYLTFDGSLNVDYTNVVIGRIDINTSVDTILGKVNTSGEFSILDKNDNAIGSGGSLKTGDKFIVTFPNQVLTYKFSIIGDVTGSGIMNNDDIILMSKHIIKGNLLLDAEYLKAADYDNNNVIDINDVIKMARKVKDSGDINE